MTNAPAFAAWPLDARVRGHERSVHYPPALPLQRRLHVQRTEVERAGDMPAQPGVRRVRVGALVPVQHHVDDRRIVGRQVKREVECFCHRPGEVDRQVAEQAALRDRQRHRLLVIPLLWCVITGITLWAMASPEAPLMPAIGAVAAGLRVWKRRDKVDDRMRAN